MSVGISQAGRKVIRCQSFPVMFGGVIVSVPDSQRESGDYKGDDACSGKET